jgi:YcxB-like protein
MAHAATLEYNEALLRRAVLAFWRRTVGIKLLLALAVIALSLLLLVRGGDRSWAVGVLASFLVIGVAFSVAIYVVHIKNSLRKFRQMGPPIAAFSAQESTFTLSSGLGTTTLAWSAISEVWRFPEFWLLLFSKAQFVTLPLASLSSEARAFILQRVEASGGKIGV